MIIGEAPKLVYVKNKILFSEENGLDEIRDEILIDILHKPAIVYWQSAAIVDFGFFDGTKVILNRKDSNFAFLQEMRLFGDDFELHIWKFQNKYRYRYIFEEEESDCQDEVLKNSLLQKVKLWGTKAYKQENFTVLTEGRGMSISLPIEYRDRYSKGINAFLGERRYIAEDSIGCINFYDFRFCGIYIEEHGVLKKVEVTSYAEIH